MTILIILFIVIIVFLGLLTHNGFIRGRKPIYGSDVSIKWNIKCKSVRVIKVTYNGGVSGKFDLYEIWERKLWLFSVRYDCRNYNTLEEATREAQRLLDYTEISTTEKEITL